MNAQGVYKPKIVNTFKERNFTTVGHSFETYSEKYLLVKNLPET